MARPLRDTTTVSIRMDVALKSRLETAASKADRTLSQECMRRLRLSFQGETEALPNGRAHQKGRKEAQP